jgi:hypothetical protein
MTAVGHEAEEVRLPDDYLTMSVIEAMTDIRLKRTDFRVSHCGSGHRLMRCDSEEG